MCQPLKAVYPQKMPKIKVQGTTAMAYPWSEQAAKNEYNSRFYNEKPQPAMIVAVQLPDSTVEMVFESVRFADAKLKQDGKIEAPMDRILVKQTSKGNEMVFSEFIALVKAGEIKAPVLMG